MRTALRPRPSSIASIVTLAVALGACRAPTLRITPRYGQLSIDGRAGIQTGSLSGAADVEQLGLDKDDTVAGRVDFDWGQVRLVAMGQRPRYEGTGTIDVTVSDGTNSITAGAPVDTELNLGMYQGGLLLDIASGDKWTVGVGGGAAYLDIDLRFHELSTGTRVQTERQLPVPLAAAVLAVWVGPVEVGAYAGGLTYEYKGDTVSYFDGDAFLRVKLFGGLRRLRGSLVAGYRITDIDAQYDDGGALGEIDLRIQGPHVGLELSL